VAKDERLVSEEDVRQEHLDEVQVSIHWAYLAGVMVGAFLLMTGLIAVLGAAGGGE
jgi:hypothetical protein